MPVAEKRIRAGQILTDWRGSESGDVRAAIDLLADSEISVAGPVEIACRATRFLETPE